MRKHGLNKSNGVIPDVNAKDMEMLMGAMEFLGYSLSSEKDGDMLDLTTITKCGVYVRGRVDSLKRLIEMLDILDDRLYERALDIKNAEITGLREALLPIVEALEAWMEAVPDSNAIPIVVVRADGSRVDLTRDHIARARAALAPPGASQPKA